MTELFTQVNFENFLSSFLSELKLGWIQTLKDHTSPFLTPHLQHRSTPSSTKFAKFNHVYACVDLRLRFYTPFTAIHVETGLNTIGHVKVAWYTAGNTTF